MLCDELQVNVRAKFQIFVSVLGFESILLDQMKEQNFQGYHCIAVTSVVNIKKFNKCKLSSNNEWVNLHAISLTSAERQKAVWMPFLNVFGQEMIGIELFSVFAPNIGSSMQRVEIYEQCYTGRNLKFAWC
jgi:hypothetical protein